MGWWLVVVVFLHCTLVKVFFVVCCVQVRAQTKTKKITTQTQEHPLKKARTHLVDAHDVAVAA
jgi:hypothetical protein